MISLAWIISLSCLLLFEHIADDVVVRAIVRELEVWIHDEITHRLLLNTMWIDSWEFLSLVNVLLNYEGVMILFSLNLAFSIIWCVNIVTQTWLLKIPIPKLIIISTSDSITSCFSIKVKAWLVTWHQYGSACTSTFISLLDQDASVLGFSEQILITILEYFTLVETIKLCHLVLGWWWLQIPTQECIVGFNFTCSKPAVRGLRFFEVFGNDDSLTVSCSTTWGVNRLVIYCEENLNMTRLEIEQGKFIVRSTSTNKSKWVRST